MWLSLVERYVRDVEAASSNLVTSTKTQEGEGLSLSFLSFSQSPPIPNLSNAKHLIVLRPKRLRIMIHSGTKQGSESYQTDAKIKSLEHFSCPRLFSFIQNENPPTLPFCKSNRHPCADSEVALNIERSTVQDADMLDYGKT